MVRIGDLLFVIGDFALNSLETVLQALQLLLLLVIDRFSRLLSLVFCPLCSSVLLGLTLFDSPKVIDLSLLEVKVNVAEVRLNEVVFKLENMRAEPL